MAEISKIRCDAESAAKLHGPFGWLNGCRGLSEDSWVIESDPLENSDEYFAIPLYALIDPFKEINKAPGPLPQAVSSRLAMARGHLLNIEAHGNAEANAVLVIRNVLSELEATLSGRKVAAAAAPRPALEWHEDYGDVVWWALGEDGRWLGEAPYIGSPLDCGRAILVTVDGKEMTCNVGGWPGYHTHWTPCPDFPPLPAVCRSIAE